MNKKNELKFWIFSFLIGLGAIFLNFDSAGTRIAEFIPQVNRILNSGVYSSLSGLRRSEANFWASVKGIDTEYNKYEAINTPKVTVTATGVNNTSTPVDPNATPTVEPTMGNYEKTKISPPFTVQLIGDSMILEGFGPMMINKLNQYQGITIKSNGRYSTGLNRIDYFDWYKETEGLIKLNKPDVLIIMFGANDGQNIIAKDGSIGQLLTPKWKTIYTQRVDDYLDLISPKVGLIYWVGHPIPRPQDFYDKFSAMNPIYKTECAKYANCRFVDEWDRFALNGKYVAAVADDSGNIQTVKGSDGVHVTNHGGNIMADEVIKVMMVDY